MISLNMRSQSDLMSLSRILIKTVNIQLSGEHNGSYDVLDATVSDGKISFETNKFSTYVIVKKTAEKAVVTNPDKVVKPQGG